MKTTFAQRALITAAVFYCTLWASYVVGTSERAERRVHQAEEVLKE